MKNVIQRSVNMIMFLIKISVIIMKIKQIVNKILVVNFFIHHGEVKENVDQLIVEV